MDLGNQQPEIAHKTPEIHENLRAVAIARNVDYLDRMTTLRIVELEELLRVANETVARLTLANAGLTGDLNDAQRSAKKLKRKSRNAERDFKGQLAVALRGR